MYRKYDADFLIADDEKGNVQRDDKHAEADAGQFGRHQGQADDAAVDDVIGHQKNIQADGVYKSAEG